MFKVLVVEDEEMIRNKILNNINWKASGFDGVFVASDGIEAMEILSSNNIDIVITDIQMPRMSGIELIREIKGSNKNIKTVIITAYAEFEYAKESVKLNVNDYILKPFKSKDLLDIVKKLTEQIIRERSERVEVENLRKQLRENKKALQDKLFNDLISNSFIGNIDNSLRYLELTQLKGKDYFIAAVSINNFMDLIREDDEEQKYIYNLTLYNWVKKFLLNYDGDREPAAGDMPVDWAEEGTASEAFISNTGTTGNTGSKLSHYVVNYKIDQIVIVFYDAAEAVNPLLEQMIVCGNKELGFNLAIGIGNTYQSITDMYISYKEACSAVMLSCLYGKGIVYSFNDINFGNTVYSKQLHILADTKLYDNLKIGAFSEIKRDIVDIITQIKSSKLSLDAVNTIIYNIMLLSCKTINELGYNVFDIMGGDFNLYFDVGQINDLAQLEEWFLNFFFKVNEFISTKRSNRNESLIAKIKEYIDLNYNENITLTSISKSFVISPGYLSVLFNDYIGQNFIDYLSNLRIQKAKSLLKNSDLLIYEIAEKVGYRDAYYFSTAFKKIVGINPTEYREKLNIL